MKKSTAVEVDGEPALSDRSCRERFYKFKNVEFNVEGGERSGRPKGYEDAELEARNIRRDPTRKLASFKIAGNDLKTRKLFARHKRKCMFSWHGH